MHKIPLVLTSLDLWVMICFAKGADSLSDCSEAAELRETGGFYLSFLCRTQLKIKQRYEEGLLMRIAVVSDELYPVHSIILSWLKEQGHECLLFGALKSGKNELSWVTPAYQAARAIQNGDCDEGIFLCWTGTGVTMVANKVLGIRAALCTDAETARGARIWNHANALALSNRLLSQDVAKEILVAWFEPFEIQKGSAGVTELIDFENTTLKLNSI